jgi:hypothetical protein
MLEYGRARKSLSCLIVVRAEGLEPPRLSPLEPKSSASTNSATPAEGKLRTILTPQSGTALRAGTRQGKT